MHRTIGLLRITEPCTCGSTIIKEVETFVGDPDNDDTEIGIMHNCVICDRIFLDYEYEVKEKLRNHPSQEDIDRFLDHGECPFCSKKDELDYWTEDYREAVQCPECRSKWYTTSEVVSIDIGDHEYSVFEGNVQMNEDEKEEIVKENN